MAIESQGMFASGDQLLVAVSGGKDSLALWRVLTMLGYAADGFHIDLGFGEASRVQRQCCEAYADHEGLPLFVFDLRDELALDLVACARRVGKPVCAVCGTVKRYLMNRAAIAGGYDCVVTGHNIDDETAKLLSNLLRWRTHHLVHQRPFLPEKEGFAAKAKPFYRLDQDEIRYLCQLEEISYVSSQCPHGAGATLTYHQEACALLEEYMPGMKRSFLYGYLENRPFAPLADDGPSLQACQHCHGMATAQPCGFCRVLPAESPPLDLWSWWRRHRSS